MCINSRDLKKLRRTAEATHVPPGLFAAEQIWFYLSKYNILWRWDKKNIKAATYEMRLGKKAIRWEEEALIEFDIEKEGHLTLKPNSLTFVTTYERFDLPYDIIARYNLKSQLVHKGLLLGTGPIVDPGFKSHIVIPLHNFSCRNVEIGYKENFISVEFTKMLDPEKVLISGLAENSRYNPSRNKSVDDFFKKTYRVGSSVMNALKEGDQLKEDARNLMIKFSNIGTIAIAGALVSIFSLIFSMSTDLADIIEKYNKSIEKVNLLEEKINNIPPYMLLKFK